MELAGNGEKGGGFGVNVRFFTFVFPIHPTELTKIVLP